MKTKTPSLISQHNPNVPERIKVVFVLLQNFSMASFTSAVDTLVTARLVSPLIEVERIICGTQASQVMSDIGIEVVVEPLMETMELPDIDMVIICGGYRTPLLPDSQIRSMIQIAIRRNIWLGGLWNGGFYMAQEGLLRGKEISMHPESLALLSESCPTAHLSDRAYVLQAEERLFSCAGPHSAMKVMLEVCGHIFGQIVKRSIEIILACDTPSSDEPAIVRKGDEAQLPYNLQLAVELMRSNIEEPLALEEISSYANVSRRQLERYFSKYLNITPSRYYIDLRLQHAKRLLTQSNLPIIQIALACGFISTNHFSRSFRDKFGLSPKKLRFKINQ